MEIVLDAGRTHESQIIEVRVLDNWFSLCTDGAIHVGYGIAIVGGVLLNRKGECIMGYNSLLGECSVFDIELWGIFDGLTLNQFAKDVNKSNEAEEMFGHGFNEERMLIETKDYEETGANTKHDPLAPPPLI
ncbi:hypothetical protein Gotur_028196 [Gossypium turneri]